MPSYLSLTDFKLFLRDSSTTYDSLYELILSGVEQAVETFVGRGPLARQAVTEYYSTAGDRELPLDRFPLLSPDDVTAVYEDRRGNYGQSTGGFDATATLLTKGVGYAVRIEGASRRAVLVRLDSFWPFVLGQPAPTYLSTARAEIPGCVKVQYTAGWTASAPADVVAACYAEAAARWASRRTGVGLQTSAGLDGYSIAVTPFNTAQAALGASPFLTEALLKAVRAYRKLPLGR